MGTGVILLLYYTIRIIYADSAFQRPIYVPRMPRNPMILMWPSVMNPAVVEEYHRKLEFREMTKFYLKIECKDTDSEIPEFNLTEVQSALVWNEEIPRTQQFWKELFPKLIQWLSAEALKCGIYSIFPEARKEIYRFISANRSNWINAVQELAYILLQVVAVIHNKTGAFPDITMGAFPDITMRHPNPLNYLQKFILDSFDIVTAWLVDYLGQRAGARDTFRPNFCRLAYRPDNCSFSFRPLRTLQTEWNLSGDPDIRCALQKSKMFKVLGNGNPFPYPFPYDFLLEALDPPDRIKAMAQHAFVTCKLSRECKATNDKNADVYFMHMIRIGYNGSEKIVRIASPIQCVFNCSDLPKHFKHNAYALAKVTAEHFVYYVYAQAYMATAQGHDLICKYDHLYEEIESNELLLKCHHRIAAKFLYEREYETCCKNRDACCERGDCELLTDEFPYSKFVTVKNVTLVSRNRRQQTLEDFKRWKPSSSHERHT